MLTRTYYRLLVDKLPRVFLLHPEELKAYVPPKDTGSSFVWEAESRPALDIVEKMLTDSWFSKIATLYCEESPKTEVRSANTVFIKSLGK